MPIRIVFLGDIVGQPGTRAVMQLLPQIRKRWRPDLVIANAENAANGSGLTPSGYQRLCAAGVDGITLGDHLYKKAQIVDTLERNDNIIRPANLPDQAKGRTWMRLFAAPHEAVPGAQEVRRGAGAADENGPSVFVATVLGRLFMSLPANDPFAAADSLLDRLPDPDPLVVLEVHAEATSEKIALGWHLNGRVAAVIGTHTHVPTADARVLPPGVPTEQCRGGTGYISDIGMCGPIDSVLGRRADRVLKHMTTSMHSAFDVAEGNPQVQGVFLQIDDHTRQTTRIEPITACADVTKPPFVAE